MAVRVYQNAFHVPGTLAADLAIRFTVPFDCQLIHISAVSSDADAAGLTVGNSTTAAAYLAKASCGVSGTPVEFDRDNFVDGQYPHIAKGTIFAAAVDHDYNAGGGASDSADLTLVFTFTEG